MIAQYPRGTFLILQLIQMERIVAVAKSQTACLMVCGCNDQCLIRVLKIEFIGYAHGFIHIPYFTESRGGIVAMTGIVYHTTFYHHEESLIARLQEWNSGANYLSQCQIAFVAVNGINQIVAMFCALIIIFLHENQFLAAFPFAGS